MSSTGNSNRSRISYNMNYLSEDEEINDKALISSMNALIYKPTESTESTSSHDETKPTDVRLNDIKQIIYRNGNNKIKPMVSLDEETEDEFNIRVNKQIMDLQKLSELLNVRLVYAKSGTTGHTFKAISLDNPEKCYAVKVCAYPKDDDHGAIHNQERPENAELRILKLFGRFVVGKRTPHFVLPIYSFNTHIIHFINYAKNLRQDTNKYNTYMKFVRRYQKGKYDDLVSVLVSEWCNGGDLLDYIRNNYRTMNRNIWRTIFFQILYTLARIHEEHPSFRHNDMKVNNILVAKDTLPINGFKAFRYSLGDYFFVVSNINLNVKIWDFDFASIDGLIENNKVNAPWTKDINISKARNQYYDLHYFFNTLMNFFPEFTKGGAPKEIVDFVYRAVPEQYRVGCAQSKNNIVKKGRIAVNHEYKTAYKILMEDPLFEKFRYKKSYFNER